jgi:phosphoglycolate phosphatase
MNKIKAIAFDMDGTLFSSDALVTKVYELTVEKLNQQYHLNLKVPTNEEITPQLGKPVHDIYKALFPTLDETYYPFIKELNGEHFAYLIRTQGGELISGVKEMMSELANLQLLLLIASNGSLSYLKEVVLKYELPVTQPIITLDFKERFVKADILEYYMNKFFLKPQEMIMVGDRIMDLEAAKAHKIPFIGVKGASYGKDQELQGASYVVENIPQVCELIKDVVLEKESLL